MLNLLNIINIINNKEVIPELLQGECNAKEIFKSVVLIASTNSLSGHKSMSVMKL